MLSRKPSAGAIRIAPVLMILAGAVALTSAPNSPFSAKDRAYYADQNLMAFVRPGLIIKIVSAEIAQDGTIKARVKLTDPRGLPLDREGVTTPGAVSVSLIAATIPRNQKLYTSYTVRTQTSPITRQSAVQASADTGGRWEKVADGEYLYTFGAKAPSSADRSATHTIGAYGSRNLTEFELGTNYDDDVFHFIPSGQGTPQTRDVIKTASCNKCHDQLAFHGGSRRSMELCVLCHTPQTTDPDTGNTVDMTVMTHKIHMGAGLPSVRAGGKYQIIGFNQSVADYSKVVFPADVRNCDSCHEQKSGAAQATAMFNASRAACGACHDNVNFATGEGHVNLPQVSDAQCTNCHIPQGEQDFDASILGAHTVPNRSRMLGGLQYEIVKVDDGAAGKRPVVTFKLSDKHGNPLPVTALQRLALVLAGPTTDYTAFQTGYVSEDLTGGARVQGGNGAYTYTFNTAIPADATGTFTIGIEGRREEKILEGTQREQTIRYGGTNKVIHFSVDGSPIRARRRVVSTDKCNACHYNLVLHGENRNQIEQCVLCHNPVETDRARRPASEMPAESVDMRLMIHRIHTGSDLGMDKYIIYGFGGSVNDFAHVEYPAFTPNGAVGDRRNCSMCHINGSERLPLADTHANVNDPRGLLNPVGPQTAACISCHTSVAAASHALANTTALGESCAACHGPNSEFSVSKSHAR